LDEYIEAALKKLPQADRDRWYNLKKEVDTKEATVLASLKVAEGLLSLAAFCGLSITTMRILMNLNIVYVGTLAIGVGIVRMLSGAVDSGIALVRVGAQAINSVVKSGQLGAKMVTIAKYLAIASKVLVVLGFVIGVLAFAYDIADGFIQKGDLQKAIKELCGRRLQTKTIASFAHGIFTFSARAESLVDDKKDWDKEVEDGKLTTAEANTKFNEKLEKNVNKLKEDLEKITPETVNSELTQLDTASGHAWTDDDPTLKTILEWIEEQGKK